MKKTLLSIYRCNQIRLKACFIVGCLLLIGCYVAEKAKNRYFPTNLVLFTLNDLTYNTGGPYGF